MKFGNLDFSEVAGNENLLAKPTLDAIKQHGLEGKVLVSKIDADFADTAKFCEEYKIGLGEGANCVVLEAKRVDKRWFVACLILATSRADINKKIRKYLEARRVSFAPMDQAVEETGMEYGGITPIGLPDDWQILVDEQVVQQEKLIIGSGIRGSKLLVDGDTFNNLANTTVMDIAQ